ncbi:hypothetical protein DFS34DRAFT_283004 [Phlyctochytrium arcticum]|nr:hypothetical protein DFS34DRAFT_283004 [Phlyctochytrium arcticum]
MPGTPATPSPGTPGIPTPTTPGTPSTQAAAPAATSLVLRISLPSHDWQKAIKASTKELVWNIKKQTMEKMASGIEDALNYGLYLPPDPKTGKPGRFLEERLPLGAYVTDSNTLLEFVPKHRIFQTSTATDAEVPGGSPSMNSKRKQKKFIEEVQKGAVDKVKEKGTRGLDPNFWTETGESPLSIAVANNDREMICALVDNGAILDYRLGKKDGWKTPLHLAAQNNKVTALQTLLGYGAWVNCLDGQDLTPIYYAANGGYQDCVLRLLAARADTEVADETGKGPLHIACFNNHEVIASLLVDYGANLNAVNAVGNTPLHVAATRNAKECAKWLVMRGCDREKANKSGQTPVQLATMSGNVDIADLFKKFTNDMIIPPPPKPQMEDFSMSTFNNTASSTLGRRDTFTASNRQSISDTDTRRISFASNNPGGPLDNSPSFASMGLAIAATNGSGSTTRRDSTRKRAAASSGARKKVGFVPPPPTGPKPAGVAGDRTSGGSYTAVSEQSEEDSKTTESADDTSGPANPVEDNATEPVNPQESAINNESSSETIASDAGAAPAGPSTSEAPSAPSADADAQKAAKTIASDTANKHQGSSPKNPASATVPNRAAVGMNLPIQIPRHRSQEFGSRDSGRQSPSPKQQPKGGIRSPLVALFPPPSAPPPSHLRAPGPPTHSAPPIPSSAAPVLVNPGMPVPTPQLSSHFEEATPQQAAEERPLPPIPSAPAPRLPPAPAQSDHAKLPQLPPKVDTQAAEPGLTLDFIPHDTIASVSPFNIPDLPVEPEAQKETTARPPPTLNTADLAASSTAGGPQYPASPSKEETQNVVKMLKAALESTDDAPLEVDLELLLGSYTALENCVEAANERASRADHEIRLLRETLVSHGLAIPTM